MICSRWEILISEKIKDGLRKKAGGQALFVCVTFYMPTAFVMHFLYLQSVFLWVPYCTFRHAHFVGWKWGVVSEPGLVVGWFVFFECVSSEDGGVVWQHGCLCWACQSWSWLVPFSPTFFYQKLRQKKGSVWKCSKVYTMEQKTRGKTRTQKQEKRQEPLIESVGKHREDMFCFLCRTMLRSWNSVLASTWPMCRWASQPFSLVVGSWEYIGFMWIVWMRQTSQCLH